jgi:hypothetical protein
MLVKMKNGNIEDVYDYVGKQLIARGIAEPIAAETEAPKTEGRAVGVEMAVAAPKTENAAVRFFRTLRSRG